MNDYKQKKQEGYIQAQVKGEDLSLTIKTFSPETGLEQEPALVTHSKENLLLQRDALIKHLKYVEDMLAEF